MNDPRLQHARCPHCGRALTYRRYHAGFSNEGFAYCDQDEAVVTWSTYDPRYTAIVDKHPWMLNEAERRAVESALRPCPFGGTFSFGNAPRCPHCHGKLAGLVPSDIYFAVMGRRVDGASSDIWL
jgi:hypothetical protein